MIEQYIHHLQTQQRDEEQTELRIEQQRRHDEQLSQEAVQSENALQWITNYEINTNSDTETNNDSEETPIVQSLSDLDELEHDNNIDSERSPPRTTQWSIPPETYQIPVVEQPITPESEESIQDDNQLPSFGSQINQTLSIRAQELITILQGNDPQSVLNQLENFLGTLASNPIQEADKVPMSLEMPLILALIQNRTDRIYRKEIFCPVDGCTRKIKTITMLSEHLHSAHRFEAESCTDIVPFFISQMFTKQLRTKLTTINNRGQEEEIAIPHFTLKRCYHPLCTFSHNKYTDLEKHLEKSHNAKVITNTLGWFWGIIKINITTNPLVSIKELLKENITYRCMADNCFQLCSTEHGAHIHFSRKHNLEDTQQWRAPIQKIQINTEFADENQELSQNIQNQENNSADQLPPNANSRRFLHDEGILRSFSQQETEREAVIRQELGEEQTRQREIYIQKRQLFLEMVQQGVNLPPLAKKDKKKLKVPLNELLKISINPLLEQMMPEPEDWNSWLAFEGVYEEALHKIRQLIISVKGRNIRQLYGIKSINPELQRAREQLTETLLHKQSAQIQLRKVKYFLQKIAIAETEEQDTRSQPAIDRKVIEWTQKIAPILDKIPDETKRQVFGDDISHENIWNELNTSSDHRDRVIEWLESLITSELNGELEEMNKQLHTQVVREAYNTTKGITMRRYINKKQSPPCAINKEEIHRFFQNSWASPTLDFEEALPDSPLYLDPKIPEDATETMKEFMLNEKNINDVIKSRSDIGAFGPDGIGNTIVKAAGEEGIRFMKNIIQGCITYGRIMESWKTAKTILIYKKAIEQIHKTGGLFPSQTAYIESSHV
jgi:hypothetical protein